VLATTLISLISAPLLQACSAGGGRPAGATVSGFLAAWDRDDTASMTSYVDRPAPGLAQQIQALTTGLHATSVTRTAGRPNLRGATGQAAIVATYTLPGIGRWQQAGTLNLVKHSGNWLVAWSPSAVAPQLSAGGRLELTYQWAPRAAILGAGGTPLTADQPQVVVGVQGSRIKDPAALTQVLLAAGATQAEVSAALASAAAHPTYFEPVFVMTEAAYAALGGPDSALHQAPGTVFQHTAARAAVTAGLAAHLVGRVGPITAQQLGQLGAPYDAASTVGQFGLESAYEKPLAGTPGGRVTAVDPSGRTTATIATFAAVGGHPVSTGIDPEVQRAAEAALASVPGTAALVAVGVSTGQVVAAVSNPATSPFDAAFDGSFPPGSTFKVLTSTALFDAGLSPASAASCPPTVTVDGRTFHNAEGDRPVSTLQAAFVESCNTAFVQLASAHLKAAAFTAVAARFGLGRALQMGYPAVAGQVPAPADGAALAATAIGQAGVLVSPLVMASVAADVARGAVLPPKLVAGAPDDSASPASLPAQTVADLHAMMAAVVTSGTAAGTGLPSGTYAKTGTAEYGSGSPLPTDAWLVGWHGDVAFAMVEQDSKGNGGPVDGPVVAHFLSALSATG
jgi:cell division protein FtsI/penicillin-binding protein 2